MLLEFSMLPRLLMSIALTNVLLEVVRLRKWCVTHCWITADEIAVDTDAVEVVDVGTLVVDVVFVVTVVIDDFAFRSSSLAASLTLLLRSGDATITPAEVSACWTEAIFGYGIGTGRVKAWRGMMKVGDIPAGRLAGGIPPKGTPLLPAGGLAGGIPPKGTPLLVPPEGNFEVT
jgi:hypothetical protein